MEDILSNYEITKGTLYEFTAEEVNPPENFQGLCVFSNITYPGTLIETIQLAEAHLKKEYGKELRIISIKNKGDSVILVPK